jgi:hypothetical protein
MEKQMTLADYAASGQGLKRPGTTCWICNLPEREEVDAALREGTSVGVIRRWLIDVRGYSEGLATRNKIENHRNKGHHERSTAS